MNKTAAGQQFIMKRKSREKSKKNYWVAGDSPQKRVGIHCCLIVACIFVLYPVSRIITVSLRPLSTLLTTDLRIIPPNATMENYIKLFTDHSFLLWLWNSLIIAVGTILLSLLLSTTAAYAFARWKLPGYRLALIFLLTTQMLPAGMLLLPIYIVVVRLNLYNTYLGMIFAYACTAIPFNIWLLRGYFLSIPRELEEAALVDGATIIQSFTRVLLPLSTPALAIAGLFSFMTCWNEFMMARVMLQRPAVRTWTLALERMQGQFSTQWGLLAAASFIVAVPVALVFLAASKYMVSGLTLGGMKE